MNNILSDQIEKIILEMLRSREDEGIILKSRELANELECAPSQITYVINTRFSDNQNFIVESRRGNGGYIKISSVKNYPVIVKPINEKEILNKLLNDLQESNIFDDVQFSLFMTAVHTFLDYCPDSKINKGINTLTKRVKTILEG